MDVRAFLLQAIVISACILLVSSCGEETPSCVDSTGCLMGNRCVDGECVPIGGMDGSTDSGGAGDSSTTDSTPADTGGATDAGDDAAPPCTAAECDDDNVCTDDRCTESGCENVPNTAACDDGMFCNGSDSCMDGACAAHTGDPCAGRACDEMADSCEGSCSNDADCPDDVVGAWTACAGFSDVCDETGMRSRDVATFSCMGGVCIGGSTTESESCTRDSDGTLCDDGSSCSIADQCVDGVCRGEALCPPGCSCRRRRFECYDDVTGERCTML
jgi:hypothetical protein